ncbi:MAG: ATP-binding protein [Gemmatimonadota bacterium]
MNFAGRLVLGTIVVLLLAVAVLVGTSEVSLRRDLESDIEQSLEHEALLVREALPADSLLWQTAIRRISREDGHRITLIDLTGRVRAESDLIGDSLPRMENHLSRPEVQQALSGVTGVNRRESNTLGRPLIYVAVPGGPGAIRVAATLDQVDAIVHRAQRSVLFAALLALIFGSTLAFFAGRSIARPLTAITAAARSIAAGTLPKFPRSGVPDIDLLVRALREMNGQLNERFDELRRERAESRALVESMVEGVLAADGRGRILTANPAARRLLGYSPEEPFPELPQLFRAKGAREIVDAALEGESVPAREVELDGHTVIMSARPLPAGGAVLVIHDVTDLRRLETVRRDFVANVSHELKTPLTSISGYAETLLEDRPDEATTQRFLAVIHANARRMQRLVDGLLDLSRIESGGWSPRPELLDATAILRETWSLFAGRAAQADVRFRTSVSKDAGQVWADADATRQILTNLFDNALRYTPRGGEISAGTVREGDGVRLTVSDTGAGITREHLPRVFERFYRADPARSREEGGTGLGLAIVKHLAEAHGGSAEATSELGGGTTINVSLPDPR